MSDFKQYLEKAQGITENGHLFADEENEVITNLKNFLNAYHKLLDADWTMLSSLEAMKFYPFKESFDEVGMSEWIYGMIEELKGN